MKSLRLTLVTFIVLIGFGWWQLGVSARTADTMVRAIISKDQAGGDVTEDLANLERYVRTHMNSTVSLDLEGSYNRDVERAQAAAQPAVNNAQLYDEANRACASRSGPVAQAECTRQYVSQRLQPVEAKTVELPSKSAYRRVFISPAWTPDAAGLALAASLPVLVVLTWKVVTHRKLSPR